MAIRGWPKEERPRELTPREPQYPTGATPMPVSPIMTDATVEGPHPFELLRRLELLLSLDHTTLEALVEGGWRPAEHQLDLTEDPSRPVPLEALLLAARGHGDRPQGPRRPARARHPAPQ